MRFSGWVFRIAAIWGFLSVPPMFFLLDRFGGDNPPPVTHPEFFYGFAGVTLAWQIVFLVIAWDPPRFRPIIPAAIVEKLAWAFTVAVLHAQGRMPAALVPLGAVDLLFAVLFTAAFTRLGSARIPAARPPG